MRRKIISIWSVLLILVVSIAVLVPGCDGEPTPQPSATIEVKATLCDSPWEGAITYTLSAEGEDDVNGTSVPGSHNVTPGTWTCKCTTSPSGAYVRNIDFPTQTVADGGNITFTLNFEKNQDASIEFLTWTINGQNVTPNTSQTPYDVFWGDVIDVHYAQHVDGCEGREVAVNETSDLSIHLTYQLGLASVYVANNWCAVVKEPEPIEKVSQVPSFNGEPIQPGESRNLAVCQPATLDVETVWLLKKCTDYIKTINWLGISLVGGEHECVLFELPTLFYTVNSDFTLVSSAEVELVDDEDVNPENNYDESPPLYLRVWPF